MRKNWIKIAGIVFGTFFCSVTAGASDQYIFPKSDTKELDQFDVYGMTLQKIEYARNEIFARHGMIFESQELMDYFQSTDWYEGSVEQEQFDAAVLTDAEKTNVDFLLEREKMVQQEGYVLDQPGYDISQVIWWDVREEEAEGLTEVDVQGLLVGNVMEIGKNVTLDLDGDGKKRRD